MKNKILNNKFKYSFILVNTLLYLLFFQFVFYITVYKDYEEGIIPPHAIADNGEIKEYSLKIFISYNDHFNRNLYNEAPDNESDLNYVELDYWLDLTREEKVELIYQEYWILLPDGSSYFHKLGPNNDKNKKYVSGTGYFEAVYDEDGNIVSDPLNKQSYNFGDFITNPFSHFMQDILPFVILGNDIDDYTNFIERIIITINSVTYNIFNVQPFKFVPHIEGDEYE